MILQRVVNTYIKSYDVWLAIIGTTLLAVVLPGQVRCLFAKDAYAIGISVLSIVFSVSFAGMAVIMSSTHDEFVVYLQKKQRFTTILNTFKFTLLTLFLALVTAIVAYGFTSYQTKVGNETQSKVWLLVFCFIFIYSLVAALLASLDSIRFSSYRSMYLSSIDETQGDRLGQSGSAARNS